jgi:hypothetical protein
MLNRKKIGNIMTELDILESSLISFELGKKDVKETIQCVHVFRKELEKIIK